MTTVAGALNLLLGAVYTSYGVMTGIEMLRGRTRGFSHFGLAWMLMAFTCGPHHLVHGAYLVGGSDEAAWLDLAVVLVGLPAGVTWFLLRLEAAWGGPGDRTFGGLPLAVEVLPILAGVYGVALATAVTLVAVEHAEADARLVPNLALVGLYLAIAAVLTRTQLENHARFATWSTSGLALSIVFSTCAVMHGVWALYGASHRYHFHGPLLTVDILAVPAAAYFLWVVWSLYRGSIVDWNAARDTQVDRAAVAGELVGGVR